MFFLRFEVQDVLFPGPCRLEGWIEDFFFQFCMDGNLHLQLIQEVSAFLDRFISRFAQLSKNGFHGLMIGFQKVNRVHVGCLKKCGIEPQRGVALRRADSYRISCAKGIGQPIRR
ncbi:hypothetical protein D3C80_1858850 [compost metagenome]